MNNEEKFRLYGVSKVTNSFYKINAEKGFINNEFIMDNDKKKKDNDNNKNKQDIILDRMRRAH